MKLMMWGCVLSLLWVAWIAIAVSTPARADEVRCVTVVEPPVVPEQRHKYDYVVGRRVGART